MSEADLGGLGFDLVQERRDGSRQYARRAHPFLSYWLLAHPDGTCQLSWEYALGEHLNAKGLKVSAQDELSLFLFPAEEVRGPFEEGWVSEQVSRVERLLGSFDLARGT